MNDIDKVVVPDTVHTGALIDLIQIGVTPLFAKDSFGVKYNVWEFSSEGVRYVVWFQSPLTEDTLYLRSWVRLQMTLPVLINPTDNQVAALVAIQNEDAEEGLKREHP